MAVRRKKAEKLVVGKEPIVTGIRDVNSFDNQHGHYRIQQRLYNYWKTTNGGAVVTIIILYMVKDGPRKDMCRVPLNTAIKIKRALDKGGDKRKILDSPEFAITTYCGRKHNLTVEEYSEVYKRFIARGLWDTTDEKKKGRQKALLNAIKSLSKEEIYGWESEEEYVLDIALIKCGMTQEEFYECFRSKRDLDILLKEVELKLS